jgi:hypothetical protein
MYNELETVFLPSLIRDEKNKIKSIDDLKVRTCDIACGNSAPFLYTYIKGTKLHYKSPTAE